MNYNSKAIRNAIESVIENSKVSYTYEQIVKNNLCCGYRKCISNGIKIRNVGFKNHPLYHVTFYGKAIKEMSKATELINKIGGYEALVFGNGFTIKRIGDNFWK